ncbi:helix-turn-helix domain-containing protein [Spirosoma aerolatum]|uniref:helix-turn-helix domain-containing protein n=1 Tax=Spirosoma aerolatum TaxID=1211326 RepID=UPI001FE61941|nr:helix-turn-helix domain-containing protein [Spirosoma aerolatum]
MPLSPKELSLHHFGAEGVLNLSDFQLLFHINRIEDVVAKIKFPLAPHRKTVYDFIFLAEGTTARSKDLYRFEFGRNTFFFLPALQISAHEYMSADAKGFFCHFDADLINAIFPKAPFYDTFPFWQFSANPLVTVNDTLREPILNILNRLLDEYESNPSPNMTILGAYLFTLFTELSTVNPTPIVATQHSALRFTEKYTNLLSRYIYSHHKVTDYASMMAITADHLNKCVKSTLGKTAQELLADMIILEAKVLLKQTVLSVSEIAFKFSETNPSDFARFFKAKTGLTPKEYRRQAIS